MEQALWTVFPRVNRRDCDLAWMSVLRVRNQRSALTCIIALHELGFGNQNYESSFLGNLP